MFSWLKVLTGPRISPSEKKKKDSSGGGSGTVFDGGSADPGTRADCDHHGDGVADGSVGHSCSSGSSSGGASCGGGGGGD